MLSSAAINRRTLLTLLGGSVATPLLAPRTALTQETWPARTVRYVNGFPAGGATDTLSRILCQKMSELSGQSFVVENRAGAGGVLGADTVAKAAPDGYTVGLGGIASNVLAIGSYAKLPYDPRGDFTFIGGVWQLPNILTARRDLFSASSPSSRQQLHRHPEVLAAKRRVRRMDHERLRLSFETRARARLLRMTVHMWLGTRLIPTGRRVGAAIVLFTGQV